MRDLHVVALSEDGRHVVLATTREAERGGFRVALDDRLRAAVQGELSRSGHAPSETMSVREIQTRLRAGESVDDLARAGVPLARVERFGGPVLSEREQVVEQARKAVLVRGRRGPSALPLGEAVDLRLSELPSIRPDSVVWTAWKGDDGLWTVQVRYSRGRARTAQWRYDVGAKTVVSVDPGSASLGHVDRPVDGEASVPPRPVRTGSRAKGGRASTAAAGLSSAPDRPGGTGTARSHAATKDDGHGGDEHPVSSGRTRGTGTRGTGTRGTGTRGTGTRAGGAAPRTRPSSTRTAPAVTVEPDAALERARPLAAPARTTAAGARTQSSATPGGASRSTSRSSSTTRPVAAARTAVSAGGTAPARTAASATGTASARNAPGLPAAGLRPPAGTTASTPAGAGARRTGAGADSPLAAPRGRGADPSGDVGQAVVRRAAPAPFGPAAVAAVRRPPAPLRPTTGPPAAAPRTGVPRTAVTRTAVSPRTSAAPSAPELPVVTRVVVGEAGLVVPAPGAARPAAATPDEPMGIVRSGRRKEAGAGERLAEAAERAAAGASGTPEVEQRVDRPVGPPTLRVVPRPYDDVDDEAAADVS